MFDFEIHADPPERPARRITRAINLLPALERSLTPVRRLRKRVQLALHRATTADERLWCLRAADEIDGIEKRVTNLIASGAAVLPGVIDPRPQRKARKRP